MSADHIRILSLEDSALDAELIERELRRAKLQFSMSRVETESDFRRLLESSDPDVILADYNLPHFDGISALKIARVIVPDTPFIFVSGSIGEERAVQALREGAIDYVIKDRLGRLPAAITRAITERRERLLRHRAQEALVESEERFQFAAQATQEVIWDWNLETDKVWFNEALSTLWGYSLPTDEVDASWWAQRIHPDERDAIMNSISNALASGDDRWSGEYRFERADGSYGHVLDRAVIVRNGGQRARRLICAMLDVTEEARAAERVRESELRFRSVAQTATDAIMVVNSQREIVFWNRGAAQMFGYSHQEVVGRSIQLLIPERELAAQDAVFKRFSMPGARTTPGEVIRRKCVTRDGVEFPVEISVSAWEAGGDIFLTAILRDVTKQVEEEARREVQVRVARTLAEATSVGHAIEELLPAIAEPLGWTGGIYWEVDESGGTLTRCAAWPPEESRTPLLDAAISSPIDIASDLCRKVCETGVANQSLVTTALVDDQQIPLHKQRIAFPIKHSERVCGVLEFVHNARVVAEPVLSMLQDLGKRIGEFAARRSTEEKLRLSEASLAEAQQLARLGNWSYDFTTGRFDWSDEAKRIYGIEGDLKMTAQRFISMTDPRDRERVAQAKTPPLAARTIRLDYRINALDGRSKHVRCHMHVITGTAEEPGKVVGTVQDVTQEVEAQKTIAFLSQRNELLLTYAAEGIFGLDRDGKVTFVNPAAAKILGWSEEEFLAAPSMHALAHHTRPDGTPYPRAECPIEQPLRNGEIRAGTEAYWKKSGDLVAVQFSSSPIFDENHRVTGAVVLIQDIEERLQLEKQLEQTRRISTLGRVAATIAHEFNNVLMGIQPFAEVIRRRAGDDEKLTNAASQIVNSVNRGKRVTQEILRFTQPAEPALQPVNIAEWLRNLAPELRALTGQRVEIALELPEHDLLVPCDPPQMQQVITNLVLNARDAMPGGGRVTISVNAIGREASYPFGRVGASMAVLTVSDTGTGMTPDVVQNIFEPLFTTKRSGTGLGLAVAEQVVSRHGGTIHVRSAPGAGTTFYIVLPTTGVVPAREVEMPRRTLQLSRVLLVEDETSVAAGIVTLLELEGVDVAVVENGGDATNAAAAFRPDAVILDVSLPDIPGTEVFRRLSTRWPDLPVIFSTGHGDERDLESYLSLPHVGFLRKPYEFSALTSMLQKVTADRSARAALQR